MWPQISQAEGATPACFSTSSTGIYWDGVLAIWPLEVMICTFAHLKHGQSMLAASAAVLTTCK